MPDYEIIEWDRHKFPVDSVPWVAAACACKKWAYAADYIRLYALYNQGGVYLDMDVMVFQSFDPFLRHAAFSCVELDPRVFYKTLHSKEAIGCGIEAAVLGAEKGHPWIRRIMEYYEGREFVNKSSYLFDSLMPRVVTRVSREYGFHMVPLYQILKHDVHIYPPDCFSSVYSIQTLLGVPTVEESLKLYENNPVRYSVHLCAHGWWEKEYNKESLIFRLKRKFIQIFGKEFTDFLKRLVPFGKKKDIY